MKQYKSRSFLEAIGWFESWFTKNKIEDRSKYRLLRNPDFHEYVIEDDKYQDVASLKDEINE